MLRKATKRILALFTCVMTIIQAVVPTYALEQEEPPVQEHMNKVIVETVGNGKVTVEENGNKHEVTKEKLTLSLEKDTTVKMEVIADEGNQIADILNHDVRIPEYKEAVEKFKFEFEVDADSHFKMVFEPVKDEIVSENKETDVLDAGNESDEQKEEVTEPLQKEESKEEKTVEFTEEEKKKIEDASELNENVVSKEEDKTDVAELPIDKERMVYVKYLLGDPEKIEGVRSIEEALLMKNNPIYTQIGENATAYLAEDGKYKIKADTPYINGLAKAEPSVAEFAKGNDFGEAITEGVSFDPVSKIATISPDVFSKEKTDFAEVQLQLLIPADIESDIKVPYTVENRNSQVELATHEGVLKLRPFMTARFQAITEETSSMTTAEEIEVYINGQSTPLSAEQYAYDPSTGLIGINVMGANLTSVHLIIKPRSLFRKGGIGEGNQNVGSYGVIAYLADGTNPDAFKIGASQEVRGKFGNDMWPATPADGPTELYNSSYSKISAPNADGQQAYRGDSQFGVPTNIFGVDFTFRRANGSAYPLWEGGYNSPIASWCHHVQGLTLNPSNDIHGFKYPWCTIRVLDKQIIGGYVHIVFGFETNLWQYERQTNGAVFEIAFKSTGSAKLQKVSANPTITENNSCYSLAGAEYGIYSDSALKKKVGTFTTDEKGNSNIVKDLKVGVYYIKETSAPKGFALDPKVYQIQVKAGETSVLKVKDLPQSDPVNILLGKVDKETNVNKPQGSSSLEGAEFTVKFYDQEFKNDKESVDPAMLGETPLRTWVLSTDSDGYTELSEAYKISGDEFYYNGNSDPTLPLGTLTIQETKAPEGYLLDDTVFVRTVTPSGNVEGVDTYNQPVIKEQVELGDFSIRKVITSGNTSEIVRPEEGAEFTAIYKGCIDQYGSFEEALKHIDEFQTNEHSTLVTDEHGNATSGKLAYGTYVVKQTKATEETDILKESFEVTVSKDGQHFEYTINNRPSTYYVKIVKKDADTGKTVTLNNASFQIVKYKKDGSIDANYIDKGQIKTDENGIVSVKNGLLWYNSFVTNADNRLSIVDKLGNYEGMPQEDKGSVTVPLQLPAGDYELQEINAPDGYLKGQSVKFSLKKNLVTETDPDGDAVLTVGYSNPKPKGRIELTKEFEDPNYIMHGSVTFDLIVTKDIVDPADGTVLYKANDVYGTYELNKENNKIIIENLPMGVGESHFKLVEKTTYENYVLNTQEYPVDFVQNGSTDLSYTHKVTVENNLIKIDTKALNADTEDNQFNSAKQITVTDVVSYEGLLAEQEYTMHGVLMDKETGEPVKNADGSVVEGYKRFTPKEANGTVNVKMTFDASQLGGKDFVVFESVLNTGVEGHETCEIARHHDLNDRNQTITILGSKIGTTAKSENGSHEQQIKDGKVTFVDTVAYENLVAGMNYKVSGVLMDKTTGKALLVDGKEVRSEATFTPETSNGTVDVTFEFDASAITPNTSLVVFEKLFEVHTDKEGVVEKIEVAKHEDIDDEGQSIHFIDIKTTAQSDNGTNEQQPEDKEIKFTDTVHYEGLQAGKEYTVKGILMNKETNEPLLDAEGKEITGETTFTPEEANGTVDVIFTLNSKNLVAGQDIVVFEDLVRDDIKIATHSDINDKDQTIHIIDVKTTAKSENNNHTGLAGKKITITDAVSYTNLEVGKEYTVKGKLMNKETNEPLLDAEGKEITGETTFTPEEANGTVDVIFTLDSSLLAGKEVVVFEDLYKEDIKVGTHADINDKDQTIRFKNYEIKVNKVDSITKKNIVSNKFEFTMFSDKDCKEEVITVAGNTEDGTALFEVKEGTWYIKETKAPQGYKLSKEIVKVEVKDDKLYVNDKEVDPDENYLYSIIYQNVMLPSMQTNTGAGTNGGMYFMMMCFSVLAFAVFFMIKKRYLQ